MGLFNNIKLSLFTLALIFIVATPAYGEWETSISKDEMTGKKSSYATSPIADPTKIMEFPYSDTKAWIGVGCNSTDEWIFFGFTTSPNLNNTHIENGYNMIQARIKWDEKVETIILSQKWGAKFLHIDNGWENIKTIISNIAKSNSALLELDWHGQGNTYFKFSLSGASDALEIIRNECSK